MNKTLFKSSDAFNVLTLSIMTFIVSAGIFAILYFYKGTDIFLADAPGYWLLCCCGVGIGGMIFALFKEVRNAVLSKEISQKIKQLKSSHMAWDIKDEKNDIFDVHKKEEGYYIFSYKKRFYVIGNLGCFLISKKDAELLIKRDKIISEFCRARARAKEMEFHSSEALEKEVEEILRKEAESDPSKIILEKEVEEELRVMQL